MTSYVPVLRTKAAEWTALRELTDDVRQSITPCLEVLPRELARSGGDTSDNLPHAVQRFAVRIRRSWRPRPIIIDTSHLTPSVRPFSMTGLLSPVALFLPGTRLCDTAGPVLPYCLMGYSVSALRNIRATNIGSEVSRTERQLFIYRLSRAYVFY